LTVIKEATKASDGMDEETFKSATGPVSLLLTVSNPEREDPATETTEQKQNKEKIYKEAQKATTDIGKKALKNTVPNQKPLSSNKNNIKITAERKNGNPANEKVESLTIET
jgi:hypothetical protein